MKPDKPHDPAVTSAFERDAPSHSVLTHIQKRTGHAPRITLREEGGSSAGAPVIDPRSQEKLALPQGRGSYQLLGEIARGGMGVVLKGHDADLGRDVALKVLNQDLAEHPEIVERFVEEAQIGGQLQHPGIVPVYELGLMADERPYFTMKLVKGRTLATLLSERESVDEDRRRFLDIFESVCQTLGYAHSRGVIHRDIKPANIMVGAFGEVQVVDWGLAKVLARGGKADERRAKDQRTINTVLETVRSPGTKSGSSTGSDSVAGSVMGTPAYMPPEQALGNVDKLDERSDVFSLGATLCEILTGSPPYRGEREHTLQEAAEASLDPALERLDACGADPELVELAKKCLRPAAAVRPRNAGVVAEVIQAHLASLEERAQSARVEAAEARVLAEQERRARKLTLALAAALVGLAVVGGGGFVWVQNERVARERDLVARLNAALNEASTFRGQELWEEAFAAVDRADALAATDPAGVELRAGIETLRVDVANASERVRADERRAAEAADFLRELEEVSLASDMDATENSLAADSTTDWATFDADYERVFAERGIEVDDSPPAQVAAMLEADGLGAELAPTLDRWLVARRYQSHDRTRRGDEEDLSACVQLVEIANLLDRDNLRADLREAMLNDDLEMITLLAKSDLSEQPPSTIVLLGVSLRLIGQRDEALRVLREGTSRHPDDFSLMLTLLDMLYTWGWNRTWNPEESLEATRYARGALAVQPDNDYVRDILIWQLLHIANFARLRNEPDRARALYREAVAEAEARFHLRWKTSMPENSVVPGVGEDYFLLGLALDGAGEPERALSAFRHFAAPELASPYAHGWATTSTMEFRAWCAAVPLQRAGDLAAAEQCFEFVLSQSPTNNWSYYGLAFTHVLLRVRAGSPDDVVAALHAGVENTVGQRDATANDLAWRAVRWPREALRAACALGETTDDAHIEANLDALFDEALRMSEADASGDDTSISWSTVGLARYRIGDYEGCLPALERAIRTHGMAPARFVAAMAHARLGSQEEAWAQYELALEVMADTLIGDREESNELFAFQAEALALLDPEGEGR